jgi:hypothetical protein
MPYIVRLLEDGMGILAQGSGKVTLAEVERAKQEFARSVKLSSPRSYLLVDLTDAPEFELSRGRYPSGSRVYHSTVCVHGFSGRQGGGHRSDGHAVWRLTHVGSLRRAIRHGDSGLSFARCRRAVGQGGDLNACLQPESRRNERGAQTCLAVSGESRLARRAYR